MSILFGVSFAYICTIYEVGDAGSVPFIAMELIAGEPLSALIAAGDLSTHAVMRIGLQIGAASHPRMT